MHVDAIFKTQNSFATQPYSLLTVAKPRLNMACLRLIFTLQEQLSIIFVLVQLCMSAHNSACQKHFPQFSSCRCHPTKSWGTAKLAPCGPVAIPPP